jgi:hypothetical protein
LFDATIRATLTAGTNGGNTHADDTAEDGVSGGDRHANSRSEGQVDGRSGDGANHAKHEHGRVVLVEGGVDDLGPDGIGDAGTDTDGAGKLHNGGEDHGLEVSDGLGSDRRRPRVGDIVGTYDATPVSRLSAASSQERGCSPMFHASSAANMVPMAKR